MQLASEGHQLQGPSGTQSMAGSLGSHLQAQVRTRACQSVQHGLAGRADLAVSHHQDVRLPPPPPVSTQTAREHGSEPLLHQLERLQTRALEHISAGSHAYTGFRTYPHPRTLLQTLRRRGRAHWPTPRARPGAAGRARAAGRRPCRPQSCTPARGSVRRQRAQTAGYSAPCR